MPDLKCPEKLAEDYCYYHNAYRLRNLHYNELRVCRRASSSRMFHLLR